MGRLGFFQKNFTSEGVALSVVSLFYICASALYGFQDLSGTGSSEGSSPVYFYQY